MDKGKNIKNWSLPEHTFSGSNNISQNYSKISLSTPQKKALEEIVKKEKEQGYLDGKKQGLQEVLPQKAALLQLMNDMSNHFKVQEEMFEQKSLYIINEICKKVIAVELSTHETALKSIVQEALSFYQDNIKKIIIVANKMTIDMMAQIDFSGYDIKFIENDGFNDFQFKLDSSSQVIEFDVQKTIAKFFEPNFVKTGTSND
ncbi:MAG: hypothetical protein AB7D28_07030 [Candidatus Berkiella sp.]